MNAAGGAGIQAGLLRSFGFWAAVVTVMALMVREYFVLTTIVDIPIRGDIREYVLYAWNLAERGVFGRSPPDVPAVADAYRTPGFPWLLALCMRLRPSGDGWYALALQCQVLLGASTVTLVMLLARRWLSTGWAVFAGLLLAFWPHHIAATGALLSEVLFGWALIAGLLAFAAALEGRRGTVTLAALAFGYGYLVNPVIALFPPILACWLWRRRGRAAAVMFAALFLLPVAGFALRNTMLPASGEAPAAGRSIVNFVQGSWPQYHQAWQAQLQGDPIGKSIMQAIDREIALTSRAPQAGAREIATRITQDPGHYAAWYLWGKPALLWDWDIRIGYGGPYVLAVRQSPLERHPLLRATETALQAANPLLTALLFTAAFALVVGGWRAAGWAPPAAAATALLALYLTGIHDVFQAEPRYANAYRPIEALLIASAFQTAASWVTQMVTKNRHADALRHPA